MSSSLQPFDTVFPHDWIVKRPKLMYPLAQNHPYCEEVNKWLEFFHSREWLQPSLIKRFQSASSWPSYYAKINELRAGYFLEEKLEVQLKDYEVRTVGERNVEFSATYGGDPLYAEVKTPLDLVKRDGGSFDSSNIVLTVLEKAARQVHPDHPNVVVLSDDTEVTLFVDVDTQFAIRDSFNGLENENISVVMLLGNCTHEEMYRMSYILNPYARHPIDEQLFEGFPSFEEKWRQMNLI